MKPLLPPPDLEALVLKHGGWDKIPQETWGEFNRAVRSWLDLVRYGEAAPRLRFSYTDLHRCAERECRMRRRVYPNRILTHRMTDTLAAREIDMMTEITDIMRRLAEGERLL
jgi:hypothetical protein